MRGVKVGHRRRNKVKGTLRHRLMTSIEVNTKTVTASFVTVRNINRNSVNVNVGTVSRLLTITIRMINSNMKDKIIIHENEPLYLLCRKRNERLK